MSREVSTQKNLVPCLSVLEITSCWEWLKSVVSEPEIRSDRLSTSHVCDLVLCTDMSPLNPEATPFVSNELTPAVGGDNSRTQVSESTLSSSEHVLDDSSDDCLSVHIVEEETSPYKCVSWVHATLLTMYVQLVSVTVDISHTLHISGYTWMTMTLDSCMYAYNSDQKANQD